METAKTTPRDFFLWIGAMASFYGAIISFIALLFEYINIAYPDPLAYHGDLYGGAVRFAMASLIVLTPIAIGLIYLIRRTILKDGSREYLWVRKWAIVLTLFLAGATVAIDLITLVTTFLGGELTTRFVMKVLVILLVASGVFMHFLAELRGYWFLHPRRAHAVTAAAAVAALLAVIAGFVIVGTPSEMRMLRADQQRVDNLQTLQYEITNYYQLKRELPESFEELKDPLANHTLFTTDVQGNPYRYEKTGDLSFKLCAAFDAQSRDTSGQGGYPDRSMTAPGMAGVVEDTWQHGAGDTCFERTIDPERFPPAPKPV